MVIDLDLGLHRKARIWTEALPDACFGSTDFVSGTLPASDNSLASADRKKFCIEYMANLGGRIAYGLLGSTLENSPAESLCVQVATKEAAWEVYSTDFYANADPILVGLPILFAQAVDAAVSGFLSDAYYEKKTGLMTFNCAAFSEVGSSQHVFQRLAVINCYYFFLRSEFESDGYAQLIAILNDK